MVFFSSKEELKTMSKDIFDFSNKSIVIVGGNGNIGRAYIEHIKDFSCKIFVIDNFIFKSDANYEFYKCDVSNPTQVKKTFQKIIKKSGRIDVLINLFHYKGGHKLNAKSSFFKKFEDYPFSEWNKAINTNLSGLFLVCQQAIKYMAKNGSIINFSSTYGLVSPDFRIYSEKDVISPISYATSKSGIIGFTKYLSIYLASKKIRVNSISPGGISNNSHNKKFIKNYSYRTPMGRLCQPEEIIGALIYLSTSASSYVTGSNIVVDGGWTTW